MAIPQIRVTREEMRKRVAYFKDLKGFDGGLPDSRYPSAVRKLYNAIGFQPPEGKGGVGVVSPVGAQAAENAAIRISEGFNLGFCEAKPGNGPMMHNHDTNETFMPLTGQWRCSWELDGKDEYFDVGPWDVCSFPAGVNRRFQNITYDEPDKTHFLMFVIGGNAPEADFTDKAKSTLREEGLLGVSDMSSIAVSVAPEALSFEAPAPMRAAMERYPMQSFVDEGGVSWRYRDNGRPGAKTLVLLPGALGNGDTAWEIAQAFDESHRVVSVTYPGGLPAASLATGLHALLSDLNAGTVAVWGSSYGAWWAQAFASRFPELVSALWLGNTFVDGDDVSHVALFDRQWLDASSDGDVLARWHAAMSARPGDLLRGVQLYMLHHGIPAAVFRGRLRQVAHSTALPAATGIPGTVISDCDDDAIITPATRDRVAARYPEARRISLGKGGHYPHITNVDELLPHLRRWLAEID